MVIVFIILGSLLKLVCVFVLAQLLKRELEIYVVSALLHPFLCFHLEKETYDSITKALQSTVFRFYTCTDLLINYPLSEAITGSG